MSYFQVKSEIFLSSAKLLHDKNYYPSVAHDAYYSCLLLMKHIWIYKMHKTQEELKSLCKANNIGVHEVLINEIGKWIKISSNSDSRTFNTSIVSLKRLRVNADYEDSNFNYTQSNNSLSLAEDIIPILKHY